MLRRHSLRTVLLMLACGFALLGQTTGAHLHLCLDGAAPPISAHVSAAGEHGEHHDGDTHTDLDLAWGSGALAKPHDTLPGTPAVLLAALWLCLLLYPAPGLRPRAGAIHRPLPIPPYLRPPLRGPPPIPA